MLSKIFLNHEYLEKQNLFISVLLLLLPVFLMSGNGAIPDIIISILSTFFIYVCFKNNNFSFYKDIIVIIFFSFFFYSLIRSLFSEYPFLSLTDEGTIFYFRFIFFALFIKYIINQQTSFLSLLKISFIFCILFVFIDGFYQFINGKNLFGFEQYHAFRVTSVMRDEAKLGRYIAFLSATLIVIITLIPNYKFDKLIIFFLIPISIAIILISGDRAPLAKYIMFVLVISIFHFNFKKIYFFSFLLSLILSLIFVLNSPKLKDRILDTTLRDMGSTSIGFAPYSDVYEEHYISALKIGKDNFYFGVGPNLFEKYCDHTDYKVSERSCSSHPHNFFIQIFAELGILGLLFLIAFYCNLLINFFSLSVKFIGDKHSKNILLKKIAPIIWLIAYLFPIIPNVSFYNHWNNIFIFLMIGIYFYTKSHQEI